MITSTYFPNEGTTIAVAVSDMRAGGMDTNQAVVGTRLGGRHEDSLKRVIVPAHQTGSR